MLSAFGVSVVFLVSYFAYHIWPRYAEEMPFQGRGAIRMIHHAFEDPDQSGLSEEELTKVFRRIRDEIRNWAKQMIDAMLAGCSKISK